MLGTGFSVDVASSWEARVLRRRPARHAPRRAAHGDRPRRRSCDPHCWCGWRGSVSADRRSTGGGPRTGGTGASVRTERRRARAAHRSRAVASSFSWIHIDDVVGGGPLPARPRRRSRAPVNLAGPETVRQPHADGDPASDRRRAGRLPARRWMLEPAMWVLRTEPELVLKSRWAAPGPLQRRRLPVRAPRTRGGAARLRPAAVGSRP